MRSIFCTKLSPTKMWILEDLLGFCTCAILPLLIIGLIALFYYNWTFSYWQRLDVPTLNPITPFGNIHRQVFGIAGLGEQYEEFYKKFKAQRVKHGGIYAFLTPIYIPIDIDLIKSICTRDFQYFTNHGYPVIADEENDPFSGNLFGLENDRWKKTRAMLTPAFTTSKLKIMFETMANSTEELTKIMHDSAQSQRPVEIKDTLGRYATDVVGSVAFGIDCNSLKDPNAEFRQYGKKIFPFDSFAERLMLIALFALPRQLMRLLTLTRSDIEEFFTRVVKKTVEYREKNDIYRKDFMHLLIQLKNLGKVTDDGKIKNSDGETRGALTMQEITTHAHFIFLAGFEAIATTMTTALVELALNPEIQEKLRREIKSALAKQNNQLTYDAIADMTYMDNVIYETLRKYPSDTVIPRVCTKDYKIPDTSVILRKGTNVIISIMGIHHDDEYYPEPDRFDPERFSKENRATRPPFSFIPFGEGPRQCLGMRFAMVQIKAGLATILSRHRVALNQKTTLPVKFSRSSYILVAEENVWLDVQEAE